MKRTSEGVDRRSFLKLGAVASTLALGGCSSAEQDRLAGTPAGVGMRYRPLGGTGLEVSEVAFGAHGTENPALMLAALEAGFNIFCTSGQYLDGREEESLGQALARSGKRRDELVFLTGNVHRKGTTKRKVLTDIDASLRRLDTDYLDVYVTGEVRTPADLQVDGVLEAFEAAKTAGKVRHLGLSGHAGGMQECLEAAIEDGRFDVFFIKYDFVSYPDQDAILRRAAERGIGSIVFKTNAGNRQQEIRDLTGGGLSFRQATVKWALTHPYVSSVACQIVNFDQIRLYAGAVGAPLAADETAMLERYATEMHDRYCRFCATCEASCPHQVAVAEVMRYAMYFKYYGREKEAMRLYDALPRGRTAAPCARCAGTCDAACPFGRPVRNELAEAHQLLNFALA